MAREGGRRAGDGPGLSSHPLPSMLPPWTCSQPDTAVPSGAPVDEACARLVRGEQEAPVEGRALGWDTGDPGSSPGSVTNA